MLFYGCTTIRPFETLSVCLFFFFSKKALMYSHLSNNRGGGAKVAKLINVEVGISVEGGIFQNR